MQDMLKICCSYTMAWEKSVEIHKKGQKKCKEVQYEQGFMGGGGTFKENAE